MSSRKKTKKTDEPFNYNPDFDYKEDVDSLNRFQVILTVPTDPVWYRTMLVLILVEMIYTCHVELIKMSQFDLLKFLRELQVLFNISYFIDILFTFLIHHLLRYQLSEPNVAYRPILLLAVELISVLPVEIIIDSFDARMCVPLYNTLKYMPLLKVFRLLYHFHSNKRVLKYSNMTLMLDFITSQAIMQCVLSTLFYFVYCHKIVCDKYVIGTLYEIISSQINGKGCLVTKIPNVETNVWNERIPIIVCILASSSLLFRPIAANMIISTICRYLHKFLYVFKINFFEQNMVKRYKMKEESCRYIMNYFEAYWKQRGGYTDEIRENALAFYPFTLRVEIAVDRSWEAFQHSNLFRDQTIDFVRYVSTLMKINITLPGEHIFQRNEMKNQMIYISEGVVEVISNENGVSGIVSLTSGSCLGESTLLIPYKSTSDFRCRSVCKLLVLERDDFMLVMRKYPSIYHKLWIRIRMRYVKANGMFLKKSANRTSKEASNRDLTWLKGTLHAFMSQDEKLKMAHQLKNVYLAMEFSNMKFNNDLFAVEFLDMLAIKERSAVDNDSVFIKSKWLWILRPQSPILRLWEDIIIIFTVYISIIIPYGIVAQNTPIVSISIYVTYCIWIIDVFVQIITPINNESMAKTVSEITEERIRTFSFIMDVMAIFPATILNCLFSYDYSAVLEMNKMFKLWRLKKMFDAWEAHFKVNIFLPRFTKHLLAMVLFVYYVACLFKLDGITENLFSAESVQFATGVGFMFPVKNMKRSFAYLLCNNIAMFLEMVAAISITSAFCLNSFTKNKISSFIDRLYFCAKQQVDSRHIFQRLDSCLNTQINENKGLLVFTNTRTLYNLPANLEMLMKEELHLKILAQLDFFSSTPLDVIRKLTTSTEIKTFHKHANIINRGVIYDEVYILLYGKSRTISGTTISFTKSGTPLNLVEICYGTPAMCTVFGLTEVSMITFNYTHYLNLLKEHLQHFEHVQGTINENVAIRDQLISLLKGKRVMLIQKMDEERSSFYKFEDRHVKDSYAEFDYYVPFDKIYPFSWFRLFLLKNTINPTGTFMFYWEMVRCVLAYVASIVYITPMMALIPMSSPAYVPFYLLDASVWVDIYIRMHVCYHNTSGILVKHPLYTAHHYITHGMIGDLIGAIPFNFLDCSDYLYCRLFLNSFRSFQLHRVLGFRKVLHKKTFLVNNIYAMAILNYFANILACYIYCADCRLEFTEDNHRKSMVCNILVYSPFLNYVYLYFMAVSLGTTTGMEGVIDFNSDRTITFITSVASIVGVFVKICISSYLFSTYLRSGTNLLGYRRGLFNLINWMKYNRASSYLQESMRIYYVIYWKWVGENDPFQLFKNLNKSLKRDMLFSFFGDNLTAHGIFPYDTDLLQDLYKNIMLEMNPLIIPKNGYVLTINDIEENIYFLYAGTVEVIAADGTCLDKLGSGSIFGNLQNEGMIRQKVSIVANTNVQVLFLKSTKFYGIIEYFPDFKRSFVAQQRLFSYYVKSNKQVVVSETTLDTKACRAGLRRYKMFERFSTFHMVCLHLSLLLDLYRIAVSEIIIVLEIFGMFMDFIHILHEIWKFRVGYINENNDLVLDVNKIKVRNKTEYSVAFSFLTCLCFDYCLIPLEEKGVIDHAHLFYIALFALRLNRPLRIVYIYKCHTLINKSMARHINVKRACVISFHLVVAAFFTAALIMRIDRFVGHGHDYLHHDDDSAAMDHFETLSKFQKFNFFLKYFTFTVTLSVFSNYGKYYTHSTSLRMLLILLFYFWLIFNVYLMYQVYELIAECSSMRFVMLNTVNYYDHLIGSGGVSSYILRKKMYRALVNYWHFSYRKNNLLMQQHCPRYLRQAVLLSVYGHILQNNPVFCHTHVDFLRQLTECFDIVHYFANDVISYKKDSRTCMYFIQRGKVAALNEESDYNAQAVEVLETGDCFGLTQGLFSRKVYDYTYRSINTCEIVELELNRWKHLLQFFPASKEFIYTAAAEYTTKVSCRKIPPEIPQEPKD